MGGKMSSENWEEQPFSGPLQMGGEKPSLFSRAGLEEHLSGSRNYLVLGKNLLLFFQGVDKEISLICLGRTGELNLCYLPTMNCSPAPRFLSQDDDDPSCSIPPMLTSPLD
jgi:hypothetical protein